MDLSSMHDFASRTQGLGWSNDPFRTQEVCSPQETRLQVYGKC